jgi:methyl-accepting chemotaxis protein
MKLKLSARIIFGYALVLTITVVLVGISIFSMRNFQSKLTIVVNNAEKIRLVGIIKQSALLVSRNTRGNIVYANDPEVLEKIKNETAQVRANLETIMKSLQALPLTSEEKEILAQYNEIRLQGKEINNQVAELIAAKKNVEAASLLANQADPSMQQSLDALEKFINVATIKNNDESRDAIKTIKISFQLMIFLTVVCIALGTTGALLITRSITRPMNSIATRIGESAGQLAAASNQLSASAGQLSQGSAEQASAIEETSSTLQESASMMAQNNNNTKQAALLSIQAEESANKGTDEMQHMMESIQEIKKSSDQIAKIIKVIDDIAFQTNILALNAAIEAARAGEAGMGFAVVAEEVRNLAGRSAQAAKDTTAIIETNIELSSTGVAVAERVREALNEITVQSKKVSQLMDEIAAASQEQVQGIEQVNKAIGQVETVTQQNAANAEESASAAEELNAQAESMKQIVTELSELVNGKVSTLNKELNQMNHPLHPIHGVLPQDHPAIGGRVQPQTKQMVAMNDPKTKVVSPEDVIPLEKDPHQF